MKIVSTLQTENCILIRVSHVYYFIAETTQEQESCFFGIHLSKSETALTEFLKCDENQLKTFSLLNPEVQEMILYRSCVKEINDDVKICATHEKFLGKEYLRRFKGADTYCLWPSHSGSRKCGQLRTPFPSRSNDSKKQSLYLYANYSIVMPFQSKICKKCGPKCRDKLKDFNEETVRSPVIIRRNVLSLSDHEMEYSQSDHVSIVSSSQVSSKASSQVSEYHQPSQESKQDKKATLDDLLTKNDIEVKENWLYHGDWNNIETRRKQQVLNYIGAGVATVIQTVVPDKSQDGHVYKDLIDSAYVEKHLDSECPITTFAKEIILAANNAGSDPARVQYFSTLYGMPGICYKFLSQFNRPNTQSDSDSDSDSSDFDPNCLENMYFNFNFNRHLWMRSVKHRLRFGYANAPVIKEKKINWIYDVEELTAIYNYVVSPLNTLRNSYGVFNIKQESGETTTIGRVIRQQSNSDMVKNIQAHLKSLGLRVPSASFIFKFLTYLPAASLKEMKGVNNQAEDAMRAFKTLDEIVENYANKCALPEDERINLKGCLSSSKTYLKTQYYNHLSYTSPVLSHCVNCSVSDPNDDKKFIADCENKHDSIKCKKCELVYETIDVMMKLMEKYKEDGILSKYESAVIYKKLTDSRAFIHQYQIHLVKVFCQENEWQHLLDKRDPSIAFFEGDWGMKYLPRRHRCKQSEWFGQNGISNHVSCISRIVPSSFEEDGITPKGYEKEVTTYVSLPNDSAKQDALTSAAVFKANIEAYKNNNPEVKKIYLKSDNAGCYKSSKLIQAMFSIAHDIPDLEIAGYVYSAPCDGKSLCDTYFAIVKHHLTKMVQNGRDITNPRQLAEAITAASGVANVVVMIGTFTYKEDCAFKKIPKITDINTISFLKNNIVVWKQGRLGEGVMHNMPKIPFPSHFDYEFVGPSVPRRNEKDTLIYRMTGEIETVEGDPENCDDFDEVDTLDDPVMKGSLYACPNENCDAEYVKLERFYKHQSERKCFKKTKKHTDTVGNYFQKIYIETYGIENAEKLSASDRRYMHRDWDEELESISLLPTFNKSDNVTENLFKKGFAVMSIHKKNAIHDDVRAFVREKYDEGEVTNRHMSYPKIVSEIEEALDNEGDPRFFPNKWLDASQVAYLITRFTKEKKGKVASTKVDDEEMSEAISVQTAEENFARQRDAMQEAVENMQSDRPISEQSHPLLLEDGTNICFIAKDYYDNENTQDSYVFQEDFSEILPILSAINVHLKGKSRRQAGKAILNYVKKQCTCIPLRRKKTQ